MKNEQNISRRKFLKAIGIGGAVTVAALTGCKNKKAEEISDEYVNQVEPLKGKMTYREDQKTHKKISLLGYGMMRLPTVKEKQGDEERM